MTQAEPPVLPYSRGGRVEEDRGPSLLEVRALMLSEEVAHEVCGNVTDWAGQEVSRKANPGSNSLGCGQVL
jgi:hypothetical protein